MLFTEKEAELVSLLPIRPFDARKAASVWRREERRAGEGILDGLASQGTSSRHRAERTAHIHPAAPDGGFF